MTRHVLPNTHLTYEGSRLPADPRNNDKSMFQGGYRLQQEVPGGRQQMLVQQRALATVCCKAGKFTALEPILTAERLNRGSVRCRIAIVASIQRSANLLYEKIA